jgi:class IV lanthipeptide synthase
MRVFALTGEGRYADAASRALNVHQTDVRSTNLSLCHGLAGLGEIYLEAAQILDDRRWRAPAEAIATTVLALSRTTPSGHLTWLVEDPATSTADLMIGTAGILHFLLRLDSGDSSVGFPLLLPSAATSNPAATSMS